MGRDGEGLGGSDCLTLPLIVFLFLYGLTAFKICVSFFFAIKFFMYTFLRVTIGDRNITFAANYMYFCDTIVPVDTVTSSSYSSFSSLGGEQPKYCTVNVKLPYVNGHGKVRPIEEIFTVWCLRTYVY